MASVGERFATATRRRTERRAMTLADRAGRTKGRSRHGLTLEYVHPKWK